MSRTNSAPNSPVIGSARMNSPRINRSFRGEKDLGELTSRVRKLQTDGYKHRRDDRDDDCCSPHLSVPASPRSVSRPSSPRPALSVPGSPRTRSKSPATSKSSLYPTPASSPGPKRPTSLLTVSGTAPASRNRTPSPRTPSRTPRTSPSPSLRSSPAPARKVSARGLSPRSPATPTKGLRGDLSPGTGSGSINLSDPEVMARIGNRAIKTVQKTNKSCDHCKRELTEDGCTAFGKVFHKECFRCHGCKKKLDGKFFSKDEKAYCANCHKSNQETCTVCKQKIVGDCVVNNNTYYHPECMKCHHCDDKLRGSYLFFQNKPICEKCFKTQGASACSGCGNSIEGTCYQLGEAMYCQDCYTDHMADTCAKCGEATQSEHVKAAGNTFHPDCFKCENCDKSLLNKSFSTDDKNTLYCPECYTKIFAFKCSVCNNPIVPKEGQTKAPRIRALDRDFHPQCFKCEDCDKVLDSRVKGSECWPMRHHILCYKCYRRRQSESESEGEE